MKNVKVFRLFLVSATTLGCVGAITAVKSNYSSILNGTKGENISHSFLLNNSLTPTINEGIGTLNYNESCVVNYTNAKNETGYHVVLDEGGTITKGESRGLQSINVVFTGKLRIITSFESGKSNYVYNLQSGTTQTIKGNYFVLEALEDDTKITSVNVNYSCEVSESASKSYSGKEFFDGNSWYTLQSSSTTEEGTQIGSSLINSKGEVEFNVDSEGTNNFGHIDLFNGSDNLYLYNTKANVGIYKNITEHQEEYATFDNCVFTYEFSYITNSTLSFMIGGAVKAKNIPGNKTGEGAYLATYVNITSHGSVTITQGSTDAKYGSDKSILSVGEYEHYVDGATENKIKFEIVRHVTDFNDATTDKLQLRIYLNGKHVTLYGMANEGRYNYSSMGGDYCFAERLSANTQYGPYFSTYMKTPSTGTSTLRITDFKWYREVDASDSVKDYSKPLVGDINGNTYNTTTSHDDNYSTAETIKSFRDERVSTSKKISDSLFRFDMTNVLADTRYSANVENNADAKLHILLSVNNGSSLGQVDLSTLVMHIRAYNYSAYNYSETTEDDWLTKITWTLRGATNTYGGLGHDQMIQISSYELKYDYSYYQFEIVLNYVDVKSYINPTNKYLTLCLDTFNNDFRPEFVSLSNTSGGTKSKERIFVTY